MQLHGSCHCGAVRFQLRSSQPVPYLRCYCMVCRKTAGAGGFAINLGGEFDSLDVTGCEHVSIYRARLTDAATGEAVESSAQRHFCNRCGSALWVWDPRWPELVHPHASAIDTELPVPPDYVHIMLGSKANWAEVQTTPGDACFDRYPDESLADWHARRGLPG